MNQWRFGVGFEPRYGQHLHGMPRTLHLSVGVYTAMSRTHCTTAPAGGSQAIIERIAVRFERPLRAYFSKRVPPGTDVDDLVQEVFLRLARRDDLSDVRNIEGYIFQTAANLLRDEGRKVGFARHQNAVLFDETSHGHEVLSPERVLLAKDTLDCVMSAIERLPHKTRIVFVLRRFEGMRYGDIARRMGISVSAVEKHMLRAVARLDKVLGDGR